MPSFRIASLMAVLMTICVSENVSIVGNTSFEKYDWNTRNNGTIMLPADLNGSVVRSEPTNEIDIEANLRGGGSVDPTVEVHASSSQHPWRLYVELAEIAKQIYDSNRDTNNWVVIAPAKPQNGLEKDDVFALYYNSQRQACAMAFKGSYEADDWLNNAKAGESPQAICGEKTIHGFHSGFVNELASIQTETRDTVNDLVNGRWDSYCKNGVYSVGHSLGGALATMMAACYTSYTQDFPRAPPFQGLYTFGAPSVSKRQLTPGFNGNQCFKGARFYNFDRINKDPVPALAQKYDYLHPELQAIRLQSGFFDYYSYDLACETKGFAGASQQPWIGGKDVVNLYGFFHMHATSVYVRRLKALEQKR